MGRVYDSPSSSFGTAKPGQGDAHRCLYKGGEEATIQIVATHIQSGSDPKAMRALLLNERGKVVDSADEAPCSFVFTPDKNEYYTVEVRNVGNMNLFFEIWW